jgi:hypothetical protein
MKSLNLFGILLSLTFFISCQQKQTGHEMPSIIGEGQMPNLVTDDAGNPHLVYGKGDSIMYSESADHGKSFSTPILVAMLPHLFSRAMRGPQIACTEEGLTILGANSAGDIYSYWKDESGGWVKAARVNDVDTVAKEGLMALSGDGKTLFAVWLDLRNNKRNKIVGARSGDGGKTWSKNMLIYASPDSSVCECCKPSVAVKGNYVYVMFRNWLRGDRDLYLIQSRDRGNNFGIAGKLGNGSWPLIGCPMDGGGIAIDANNNPQTVWRRHSKIFSCQPGKPEIEIGEGRSCTIESENGKNVYAWTENGEVVIRKPEGMKKNLGKGQLPVIKRINNEQIICVWENDQQIHSAVVEL